MQQNQNIEFILSRISFYSDERAFRQFFDMYANRLFQFSLSFLKNRLLAEEVVSDVFFKVWIKRTDLVNMENIKAYLFKATYNTTLNYLEQSRREKVISLDDIDVDLGIDRICPETDLINRELKEMIEKAIESLPSRCKLIYKMAKVEQMKYKEIAELLDISVKTIDHQLTIAIKRIGETIRQYLSMQNGKGDYLVLLQLFIIDKKSK